MGLHLLAHVPGLPRSLRAGRIGTSESPLDGVGGNGTAGRWIAVAGTLAIGAVLAIGLIPDFSLWTAPGAFPHHHHDG